MPSAEPYLSIVVTARNDDHGGNLLGRMQAFVNGWLNQARHYQLPSELIIVEWNPPADRPRLAQALRWPQDPGPCTVRVIEVSPELHARYPHGSALPLYQMIGKNAGIRRARGKFVLATNIDILFSSELAAFLAEQRLDPCRMYRIDRHDAMSGVPVDAAPAEQLAYCESHLIRVNRRDGTFPVAAPGVGDSSAKPAAAGAAPDWGVRLDEGWFPPERYGTREVFQWATERASLLAEYPPAGASALVLEIEPGPGTGGLPLDLEIAADGASIGRFQISRRCRLQVRRQWAAGSALMFRVHGKLVPAGRDPRILPFRLLGTKWQTGNAPAPAPSASVQPLPFLHRVAVVARNLNQLIARLAHEGPLVELTVMVSPGLQRILRAYSDRVSLGDSAAKPESRQSGTYLSPVFLHTNACGDFTLLSRDRWLDLRGYPEFDLFSMNLDSVFCYAAHHGGAPEQILSEPMRIYHIEHGTGSGWTPEGQTKLFQRIAELGLQYVDNNTVLDWAVQMRRLDAPMIFNHEDWGLEAFDLPETVPAVPARLGPDRK